MKKLLAVAVLIALTASLSACGKSPGTASGTDISLPAVTEPGSTSTPEAQEENAQPQRKFPILVPADESITVDLNGDGQEDIVSYEPSNTDPDYWYMIGSIIINDVDFTKAAYEMGYYSDSPDPSYYAITDIDEADGLLEVALLDWGPSDDLITSFFRYDGENISYLGRVTGILYNSYSNEYELSFDGKGTISSYTRLVPFQTWFAPAEWIPGESGFELVPQDIYYSPQKNQIKALTQIYAYTEKSLDSERIQLPVDTTLVAIGTDNGSWVLTENMSGDEIWIYLENGYEIETPNGSVSCWEAFDGLTLYD